ncbi:MAG: OmpA family protein [Deltaproteobacteria bacterium]|nr:OmpA family protein [Deltaproteobacteria bacterium]
MKNLLNMKNLFLTILLMTGFLLFSHYSLAAYQSGFDAINFKPAIDGGKYHVVYGSQNLKAKQGTLGFYFDYANKPLEFRATGPVSGRQSVLEHTFVADFYGALGFTDWFEAGINIPVVAYNFFYTPNAAAVADHGAGMGDIMVVTKFRLVDIDKHGVGFGVVPYMTLPTGDTVRYNGSGHVMGGVKVVLDGRPHERVEMALNAGVLMRDDVSRTYAFVGGATPTIRVDDLFTYGGAVNVKFTKNFQGIAEAQGSTVMRDFFATKNVTSLETGGGLRYLLGDSGFAIDAGGTAGLIQGIGTPRFRAFAGLKYKSHKEKVCAKPDPRIQGNKIVLLGKIFFDTAKATIKPVSYPVLDDVVDVLNTHPEIKMVEVQGHTDFRGSDEYNIRLSDARSHSALEYLISKGIDSSRLVAKGYGETQPIATNSTVDGMSKNRRTEFIIMQ